MKKQPEPLTSSDRYSDHRCAWAESDPLMRACHDTEWGRPEHDPRALWETLMLEGFQAGLAWITVLRKREAFREAFAQFDPARLVRFGEPNILRLLDNPGIIRSRAKIVATLNGARIFCDMADRGEDFASFCWSFTDGQVCRGNGRTKVTLSPLSAQISSELKRRGFKFVGPTIVYAWMQAVGNNNLHSPAPRCISCLQFVLFPNVTWRDERRFHEQTHLLGVSRCRERQTGGE